MKTLVKIILSPLWIPFWLLAKIFRGLIPNNVRGTVRSFREM